MSDQIISALSMADIFDTLTRQQLELVAAVSEPMTYQAGDIIIKENGRTDSMFIIVRGSVEILVNPGFVTKSTDDNNEMALLTELRQGQVVGEIALVDQGIRTATARIGQDMTELLRIPRSRIIHLCDTHPELGYKIMSNLAADLAYKIRNTDLTMRQYQSVLTKENA
jgi:CRP-like cAMP-binding protein